MALLFKRMATAMWKPFDTDPRLYRLSIRGHRVPLSPSSPVLQVKPNWENPTRASGANAPAEAFCSVLRLQLSHDPLFDASAGLAVVEGFIRQPAG